MRITHIHEANLSFGGAELYVESVAAAQRQAGHKVSVVYTCPPPPNASIPQGVFYTDRLRGGLTVALSPERRRRFLALLSRENPQVVHLHGVRRSLNPRILRDLSSQWPTVYTIHDLPDPSRLSWNQPLPRVLHDLTTKWNLHCLKTVSAIVVHGPRVATAMEALGFPQKKLHVLPPYLAVPPAWETGESPGPPKIPTILFIGRFTQKKGVFDLLRAVSTLGDLQWQLVLVGEGEALPLVRASIAEHPQAGRIRLVEPVSHSALGSFYQEASVVVVPSRFPETFCYVGVEAGYWGRPVVAYRASILADWMVEGETGLLAEHGDTRELGDKIASLLRKPELAAELGRNARERCASRWLKKDSHLEALLALYRQVSPRSEATSRAHRPRVLIEASALLTGVTDGSTRYLTELLRGLYRLSPRIDWDFSIHLGKGVVRNLQQLGALIGVEAHDRSKPMRLGVALRGLALFGQLETVWINRLRDAITPENFSRVQEVKRSLQRLMARGSRTSQRRYDLVHLTMPQFYGNCIGTTAPLVTTVHDLSHIHFPELHTKNNVVSTENGLRYAMSRNSRFIAVSRATLEDLHSVYQTIGRDKTHRVYEGVDSEVFHPVTCRRLILRTLSKYGLPDRPYVLSLGTLEPRKNLKNMIVAFNALVAKNPKLDLVYAIAGSKGWKFRHLFTDPKLRSERIFFLGSIEDQDLACLYSGARVFAYVSYFEGFGLPQLEAMACGTPVLYGDNTSMPEVVGDAGLAADPADPLDIGDKLSSLLWDGELRERAISSGLARARELSWTNTATETLGVYARAMDREPPSCTLPGDAVE